MPLTLIDIKFALRLFIWGVRDRCLGSKLGLVWVVANPILMLSIFTYVFGFVFKSKLPGSERSLDYVVWLISGYGPWLAISESLSSGTSAVTSNTSLVKNISFKTELLPISYSLMGIIPLVIATFFVLLLQIFLPAHGYSGLWSVIPLCTSQFLLTAGIALFLSSLNVFIRDVALVLPNILIMLLFTSPIFFPIESFPLSIRWLVMYNPFYLICDGYRQAVMFDTFLALPSLAYLFILSGGIFLLGLSFFKKLKTHFDSRI